MNIEAIRSELEEDLSWRTEEIRLLTNQINFIRETERERYYRTLVVMLYAHVEGFTKFCAKVYLLAIINTGIPLCRLKAELQGTGIDGIINGIEDTNQGGFYLSSAPAKHRLSRAFRLTEFMNRFDEIRSTSFTADLDDAVDTESNLKPKVLRRILYRIGLSMDVFSDYEDHLDSLAARRHTIAHGEHKAGIRREDYARLETNALLYMEELIKVISQALVTKAYLSEAERLCPII